MSAQQSTNHLLMIEPAVFYANPETMDTNVYQTDGTDEPPEVILERALAEFRVYRDMLVSAGVTVTTMRGAADCPDMIFPNWVSTYTDGSMIIYPMLNDNRRAEKRPRILEFLRRHYPDVTDWSAYEQRGLALESTASIVSDHINRRAYAGLSRRTAPELVAKWAEHTGYQTLPFSTTSHTGLPVYHTDFLMFIGTGLAGICTECLSDVEERNAVLKSLQETHEVIELTPEQLQSNCGNALEVVGRDNTRLLTLSQSALEALTPTQEAQIARHYTRLVTPSLTTIETYGGGSARCMLMELF
ncbi:MAG: arginine deiminase-related protein [Alphaproteobacteria bacterium]